MAGSIDFYFDFSSPYGYFAATAIDGLAAEYGRAVAWKPIMLGPIMKETGNRPLVDQGAKGAYAVRDWQRLGRLMNVPWVLPEPFPIAAVAASRAFWWLDDRDGDLSRRFARAAFDAYFGKGLDIMPVAAVATIAASVGADGPAVAAALQDQAVKDRLRIETASATAAGVCGSPFFIVDGEPFWGADRLPMVRRWLERGAW